MCDDGDFIKKFEWEHVLKLRSLLEVEQKKEMINEKYWRRLPEWAVNFEKSVQHWLNSLRK